MAVNDEIFKNLEVYGGGTINERVYNFLGSLGYTGTINDRLGQFEEGGRKGWQGLIRAWGQWAPAQLFSQGQEGVWYEPKPIVAGQQVIYQDSAGTTPVSADGDPVGLMLDRHLGLVLGPEEVSNGTFDNDVAGWRSNGDATIEWEAGRAKVVVSGSSGGMREDQGFGLTVGKWYSIGGELQSEDFTGDVALIVDGSSIKTIVGANGSLSAKFRTSSSNPSFIIARVGSSSGTFFADNITVRELPGNHATQSTSAARPIYRTNGALHWIEFDGVDDYLDLGTAHQEDWAGYVACSDLQTGWLFGGRDNTTSRWYLGFGSARPYGAGDLFEDLPTTSASDVFSLVTQGGSFLIREGDAVIEQGAYTGSTQPGASSFLFARNNVGTPTGHMPGKFFGGVFISPINEDAKIISYFSGLIL